MRIVLEVEQSIEVLGDVIAILVDLPDQPDCLDVILPSRPNAQAVAARRVCGGNASEYRQRGRDARQVDASSWSGISTRSPRTRSATTRKDSARLRRFLASSLEQPTVLPFGRVIFPPRVGHGSAPH